LLNYTWTFKPYAFVCDEHEKTEEYDVQQNRDLETVQKVN